MHVSKAHNIALLFNYSVLSGIFREELQLKNSFNRRHRKGFGYYTQTDEIGNPGATWKFSNGSSHTQSSCRGFRQDTTKINSSKA
jgi:hypothetical protein